jgi:hypothetical protein
VQVAMVSCVSLPYTKMHICKHFNGHAGIAALPPPWSASARCPGLGCPGASRTSAIAIIVVAVLCLPGRLLAAPGLLHC